MEKQEEQKFIHRVSKGSRYNQIYIPREMQQHFSIGDIVEVRLLEQKERINYPKNIKLGDFKKDIIKKVFSLLKPFKFIEQIVVFGSFVTQETGYGDIDITLIIDKVSKEEEKIEEKAYFKLIKEIPLNFHIISFDKEKLKELLKFCPLTRSMFYYSISDKEIEIPKETIINKDHLKFLLMMPEDLLKVTIPNSRTYFDSIRRLITIYKFLKKEDLDPIKITIELRVLLGALYEVSRRNEALTEDNYKTLKLIIKDKLREVNKMLK